MTSHPHIDLTRLRFHVACHELRTWWRSRLEHRGTFFLPDGWRAPGRGDNETWLIERVLRG